MFQVSSDTTLVALLALASLMSMAASTELESNVSQPVATNLARRTQYGQVAARKLASWHHLGIDLRPANVDTGTYSAAVAPVGIIGSSLAYVRTERQTPTVAPILATDTTAVPTLEATTDKPEVCPNNPLYFKDKDDNCVCPEGQTCFESGRNLEAAKELTSNMNDEALEKTVIDAVNKDPVKDGCTAHGEGGKVIASREKYRSDCKHCQCHSTSTTQTPTTAAPPFTTMMAVAETTNFPKVVMVAVLILATMHHH